MADRDIVVAVESASTGGVLGLRLSAAENGRSLTVRRDTTYDSGTASDLIGLGVNVVNRTSAEGTVLNLGADWDELQGNGQTFAWTTAEEVAVKVYAIPLGHTSNRAASVPATATPKPLITSGLGLAMTLEIGEDAYFRPDQAQSNDYYASVRQVIPPEDETFYYTTRDKVEARLLTPTNREAGFDVDFHDIITDCILAAEAQLDVYLGRDFRPHNTEQTLSIFIRSEALVLTPDIRGDRNAAVAVSGTTLTADTDYMLGTPYPNYNVRKNVRPLSGSWTPQAGQVLSLTYTPGWPTVPAPITEAATRAAAELYRAGEIAHGIVETGGMPVYARMPMKGVIASLRPFRAVSV